MDANGHAEDGLEQMLWMYILGAAHEKKRAHAERSDALRLGVTVPPGFALSLNLAELRDAYQSACGIQPDREDLKRWLDQIQTLLPYFQPPKQ